VTTHESAQFTLPCSMLAGMADPADIARVCFGESRLFALIGASRQYPIMKYHGTFQQL
jgi:hypothetical protein